MQEDFVEGLISELRWRRDYLRGAVVETVYFGGGTPTLLGEKWLHRIFDEIAALYPLSAACEVTVEANPDDLTLEVAQNLRRWCNRLSMGIQSFDDAELRMLGRSHDATEAKQAIENARQAGFDNLSLDLIWGIQNDGTVFQQSLEQLLAFRPEHISAYTLTCEPGTILAKRVDQSQVHLAEERSVEEQYLYLIDTLRNNHYIHYEVSNYSLPGFHSKHNSNYWNGTPYLGIGPAAHSFDGDSRQWNVSSVKAYVETLRAGSLPAEIEPLTEEMRYIEFLMLRLRTAAGVSLKEIAERFGTSAAEEFRQRATRFVQSGEMEKHGNLYHIAEKAVLVSDWVISEVVD